MIYSVIAQVVERQREQPDLALTRVARAAVEGAAQLLTYQAARDYVHAVSPYFQSLSDLQAM